mmetsp:Transcript_13546/g.32144  ORF Transcript_13546/g.32144 Transcript_13546/m.32144 type:complete len:542 (-) Transcript_13546:1424-3049(-)
MEVVGGSRAVDNLHIALLDLHTLIPAKVGNVMRIFIHLLQEALHSARRMFGSLTIVSVRQEHHETTLTEPLVLSRHNELVDHDLSSVHKVTELSLPKNEAVGVLQTVPVLETKDSKLGEDRVTSNEAGLRIGTNQLLLRGGHVQILGQGVERGVLLLGVLILHNSVAMTERTTLHILTGDANMVAFDEKGAKGHGLRRAPVDASPFLGHLTSRLEDFSHLPVQLEPLWHAPGLHSDHLQRLGIDAGGTDAAHLRWTFEATPPGTEPVIRLGFIRLALLELVFVVLKSEVADLLQLLVGGGAVLDEAFLIDFERAWVLLDLLVQLGLGEEGLIELVVAVAAVADHVNDDIGSPLVTVLHGRLKGGRYGERVIAIAVEDGNIEGLAKVGAVRGRSRVDGVGGEANLIVDNDVNGTTDVEIGHTGKLHGLVHDALAGEGGIAVKEDGDAVLLVDVAIAAVVLLGSGLSGHDGVDALQVGGVGNQTEMDLPSIRVRAVHAGSQVILDVAADAPLPALCLGVGVDVVVRALELGEDERHGLAHHVG